MKNPHSHITDALAYLTSQPFVGPGQNMIPRQPIHDGSFFTLDHGHIPGSDLNIRIGSTTDEGDVEASRAEVEELYAALGKWLHDTTPMARTERNYSFEPGEGIVVRATVCLDCGGVLPIADYHQCPVRGKVRVR